MCDDCEYKAAIALGEEILNDIDELPEAAEDFADSIKSKVESILEWIEENEHVTDKQMSSLQNMKSGIEKWMN